MSSVGRIGQPADLPLNISRGTAEIFNSWTRISDTAKLQRCNANRAQLVELYRRIFGIELPQNTNLLDRANEIYRILSNGLSTLPPLLARFFILPEQQRSAFLTQNMEQFRVLYRQVFHREFNASPEVMGLHFAGFFFWQKYANAGFAYRSYFVRDNYSTMLSFYNNYFNKNERPVAPASQAGHLDSLLTSTELGSFLSPYTDNMRSFFLAQYPRYSQDSNARIMFLLIHHDQLVALYNEHFSDRRIELTPNRGFLSDTQIDLQQLDSLYDHLNTKWHRVTSSVSEWISSPSTSNIPQFNLSAEPVPENIQRALVFFQNKVREYQNSGDVSVLKNFLEQYINGCSLDEMRTLALAMNMQNILNISNKERFKSALRSEIGRATPRQLLDGMRSLILLCHRQLNRSFLPAVGEARINPRDTTNLYDQARGNQNYALRRRINQLAQQKFGRAVLHELTASGENNTAALTPQERELVILVLGSRTFSADMMDTFPGANQWRNIDINGANLFDVLQTIAVGSGDRTFSRAALLMLSEWFQTQQNQIETHINANSASASRWAQAKQWYTQRGIAIPPGLALTYISRSDLTPEGQRIFDLYRRVFSAYSQVMRTVGKFNELYITQEEIGLLRNSTDPQVIDNTLGAINRRLYAGARGDEYNFGNVTVISDPRRRALVQSYINSTVLGQNTAGDPELQEYLLGMYQNRDLPADFVRYALQENGNDQTENRVIMFMKRDFAFSMIGLDNLNFQQANYLIDELPLFKADFQDICTNIVQGWGDDINRRMDTSYARFRANESILLSTISGGVPFYQTGDDQYFWRAQFNVMTNTSFTKGIENRYQLMRFMSSLGNNPNISAADRNSLEQEISALDAIVFEDERGLQEFFRIKNKVDEICGRLPAVDQERLRAGENNRPSTRVGLLEMAQLDRTLFGSIKNNFEMIRLYVLDHPELLRNPSQKAIIHNMQITPYNAVQVSEQLAWLIKPEARIPNADVRLLRDIGRRYVDFRQNYITQVNNIVNSNIPLTASGYGQIIDVLKDRTQTIQHALGLQGDQQERSPVALPRGLASPGQYGSAALKRLFFGPVYLRYYYRIELPINVYVNMYGGQLLDSIEDIVSTINRGEGYETILPNIGKSAEMIWQMIAFRMFFWKWMTPIGEAMGGNNFNAFELLAQMMIFFYNSRGAVNNTLNIPRLAMRTALKPLLYLHIGRESLMPLLNRVNASEMMAFRLFSIVALGQDIEVSDLRNLPGMAGTAGSAINKFYDFVSKLLGAMDKEKKRGEVMDQRRFNQLVDRVVASDRANYSQFGGVMKRAWSAEGGRMLGRGFLELYKFYNRVGYRLVDSLTPTTLFKDLVVDPLRAGKDSLTQSAWWGRRRDTPRIFGGHLLFGSANYSYINMDVNTYFDRPQGLSDPTLDLLLGRNILGLSPDGNHYYFNEELTGRKLNKLADTISESERGTLLDLSRNNYGQRYYIYSPFMSRAERRSIAEEHMFREHIYHDSLSGPASEIENNGRRIILRDIYSERPSHDTMRINPEEHILHWNVGVTGVGETDSSTVAANRDSFFSQMIDKVMLGPVSLAATRENIMQEISALRNRRESIDTPADYHRRMNELVHNYQNAGDQSPQARAKLIRELMIASGACFAAGEARRGSGREFFATQLNGAENVLRALTEATLSTVTDAQGNQRSAIDDMNFILRLVAGGGKSKLNILTLNIVKYLQDANFFRPPELNRLPLMFITVNEGLARQLVSEDRYTLEYFFGRENSGWSYVNSPENFGRSRLQILSKDTLRFVNVLFPQKIKTQSIAIADEVDKYLSPESWHVASRPRFENTLVNMGAQLIGALSNRWLAPFSEFRRNYLGIGGDQTYQYIEEAIRADSSLSPDYQATGNENNIDRLKNHLTDNVIAKIRETDPALADQITRNPQLRETLKECITMACVARNEYGMPNPIGREMQLKFQRTSWYKRLWNGTLGSSHEYILTTGGSASELNLNERQYLFLAMAMSRRNIAMAETPGNRIYRVETTMEGVVLHLPDGQTRTFAGVRDYAALNEDQTFRSLVPEGERGTVQECFDNLKNIVSLPWQRSNISMAQTATIDDLMHAVRVLIGTTGTPNEIMLTHINDCLSALRGSYQRSTIIDMPDSFATFDLRSRGAEHNTSGHTWGGEISDETAKEGNRNSELRDIIRKRGNLEEFRQLASEIRNDYQVDEKKTIKITLDRTGDFNFLQHLLRTATITFGKTKVQIERNIEYTNVKIGRNTYIIHHGFEEGKLSGDDSRLEEIRHALNNERHLSDVVDRINDIKRNDNIKFVYFRGADMAETRFGEDGLYARSIEKVIDHNYMVDSNKRVVFTNNSLLIWSKMGQQDGEAYKAEFERRFRERFSDCIDRNTDTFVAYTRRATYDAEGKVVTMSEAHEERMTVEHFMEEYFRMDFLGNRSAAQDQADIGRFGAVTCRSAGDRGFSPNHLSAYSYVSVLGPIDTITDILQAFRRGPRGEGGAVMDMMMAAEDFTDRNVQETLRSFYNNVSDSADRASDFYERYVQVIMNGTVSVSSQGIDQATFNRLATAEYIDTTPGSTTGIITRKFRDSYDAVNNELNTFRANNPTASNEQIRQEETRLIRRHFTLAGEHKVEIYGLLKNAHENSIERQAVRHSQGIISQNTIQNISTAALRSVAHDRLAGSTLTVRDELVAQALLPDGAGKSFFFEMLRFMQINSRHRRSLWSELENCRNANGSLSVTELKAQYEQIVERFLNEHRGLEPALAGGRIAENFVRYRNWAGMAAEAYADRPGEAQRAVAYYNLKAAMEYLRYANSFEGRFYRAVKGLVLSPYFAYRRISNSLLGRHLLDDATTGIIRNNSSLEDTIRTIWDDSYRSGEERIFYLSYNGHGTDQDRATGIFTVDRQDTLTIRENIGSGRIDKFTSFINRTVESLQAEGKSLTEIGRYSLGQLLDLGEERLARGETGSSTRVFSDVQLRDIRRIAEPYRDRAVRNIQSINCSGDLASHVIATTYGRLIANERLGGSHIELNHTHPFGIVDAHSTSGDSVSGTGRAWGLNAAHRISSFLYNAGLSDFVYSQAAERGSFGLFPNPVLVGGSHLFDSSIDQDRNLTGTEPALRSTVDYSTYFNYTSLHTDDTLRCGESFYSSQFAESMGGLIGTPRNYDGLFPTISSHGNFFEHSVTTQTDDVARTDGLSFFSREFAENMSLLSGRTDYSSTVFPPLLMNISPLTDMFGGFSYITVRAGDNLQTIAARYLSENNAAYRRGNQATKNIMEGILANALAQANNFTEDQPLANREGQALHIDPRFASFALFDHVSAIRNREDLERVIRSRVEDAVTRSPLAAGFTDNRTAVVDALTKSFCDRAIAINRVSENFNTPTNFLIPSAEAMDHLVHTSVVEAMHTVTYAVQNNINETQLTRAADTVLRRENRAVLRPEVDFPGMMGGFYLGAVMEFYNMFKNPDNSNFTSKLSRVSEGGARGLYYNIRDDLVLNVWNRGINRITGSNSYSLYRSHTVAWRDFRHSYINQGSFIPLAATGLIDGLEEMHTMYRDLRLSRDPDDVELYDELFWPTMGRNAAANMAFELVNFGVGKLGITNRLIGGAAGVFAVMKTQEALRYLTEPSVRDRFERNEKKKALYRAAILFMRSRDSQLRDISLGNIIYNTRFESKITEFINKLNNNTDGLYDQFVAFCRDQNNRELLRQNCRFSIEGREQDPQDFIARLGREDFRGYNLRFKAQVPMQEIESRRNRLTATNIGVGTAIDTAMGVGTYYIFARPLANGTMLTNAMSRAGNVSA
jgi:hypothetical protein